MTEANDSKNKSPGEENIIYIGSDHAGFRLKEYIRIYLTKTGYTPVDMGNEKYEPGDDYPDYAARVAKKSQYRKIFMPNIRKMTPIYPNV